MAGIHGTPRHEVCALSNFAAYGKAYDGSASGSASLSPLLLVHKEPLLASAEREWHASGRLGVLV